MYLVLNFVSCDSTIPVFLCSCVAVNQRRALPTCLQVTFEMSTLQIWRNNIAVSACDLIRDQRRHNTDRYVNLLYVQQDWEYQHHRELETIFANAQSYKLVVEKIHQKLKRGEVECPAPILFVLLQKMVAKIHEHPPSSIQAYFDIFSSTS